MNDLFALVAHILRHDDDDAVAFSDAAQRKTDTRVSGRRFYDRHAGL